MQLVLFRVESALLSIYDEVLAKSVTPHYQCTEMGDGMISSTALSWMEISRMYLSDV
jgi:hypothetical protein